MKQKKDQFIIAYLCNLEKTQAIIDAAVEFALRLQKGLILLHISDTKYTSITKQEAEEKLIELNKQIEQDHPQSLLHSYCAIDGKTKDILFALPNLLNAVLLVGGVEKTDKKDDTKKADSPKTLLKNLYTSRIAYFILQNDLKEPISFDKVVITIDNMRESKEKTLWASYFGRFFKSDVIVFYHNYKDEYYRHQLHYNIKFVQRMFDNLKLPYSLYLSQERKEFVDYQATKYAKEEKAGIVIAQTTKNRDWINRLMGVREEKTIINNEDIPILFVNPRDDLFVLCD